MNDYISRNEAILQNMLGADNVLLPPESPIETLLQELLNTFNGLSFMKCTQAEYDAMETHDENTVYIISD